MRSSTSRSMLPAATSCPALASFCIVVDRTPLSPSPARSHGRCPPNHQYRRQRFPFEPQTGYLVLRIIMRSQSTTYSGSDLRAPKITPLRIFVRAVKSACPAYTRKSYIFPTTDKKAGRPGGLVVTGRPGGLVVTLEH